MGTTPDPVVPGPGRQWEDVGRWYLGAIEGCCDLGPGYQLRALGAGWGRGAGVPRRALQAQGLFRPTEAFTVAEEGSRVRSRPVARGGGRLGGRVGDTCLAVAAGEGTSLLRVLGRVSWLPPQSRQRPDQPRGLLPTPHLPNAPAFVSPGAGGRSAQRRAQRGGGGGGLPSRRYLASVRGSCR